MLIKEFYATVRLNMREIKFKWLDKTTKRVRKYNEPMFKNTNIVFSVVGNIFENPELLKEKEW